MLTIGGEKKDSKTVALPGVNSSLAYFFPFWFQRNDEWDDAEGPQPGTRLQRAGNQHHRIGSGEQIQTNQTNQTDQTDQTNQIKDLIDTETWGLVHVLLLVSFFLFGPAMDLKSKQWNMKKEEGSKSTACVN